ncbi:MAG: hypothetical protein WCA06_15740 [Terrimicrobiaceae bacterium]
MRFQIRFRTICAVHLWHDFLMARGSAEFDSLTPELQERILAEYSIGDSLSIAPTDDTEVMLARHKIRFLSRPTGFALAGAVSESEAQPGLFRLDVPLPSDLVLRFAVNVIRPAFLEEANLPVSRSSLFLLANRTGMVANDELHLTQPIAAFDPARSYQAGDLVVDQTPDPTVLLEASADVGPADAPAAGRWVELPAPRFNAVAAYQAGDLVLHDRAVFAAKTSGTLPAPPATANWTKLYDASLRAGVSGADLIPGLPRVARFPLVTPRAFVTITVRDRDGQVVFSDLQLRRDDELLTEAQVSLQTAPPGRYTLEARAPDGTQIAELPTAFYLHPGAERGVPFAIFELSNPAGALALFNASGHLQSTEYHIRFRHRRAFWRYIFHGDLASFPPADLGELVQEDPADNSRYVTSRPFPLTVGLVALKNFDGKRPLPNPPPSSTRKEGGKLFAETFLKN